MDEVPRRTFGAMVAAAAGTVSGCQFAAEDRRDRDGGETVTSRSGLEETFANLSPGQTVYVAADGAPYRTTEWLDVDVDGVTIVGPGVRNLVVPADGADVGGIRIGHGSRCRDVTVRGIGFHGNPDGQSDDARRLHGVLVQDGRNVTLEGNHVQATWPRRHGDGGSGISVGPAARDVEIRGNRVRKYGDRGIQVAGDRMVVAGNVVTVGLDRPVAADVWSPGAKNHVARNVSVYGNVLGESYEGSLLGIGKNDPARTVDGYVNFHGNLGFGAHKSFCHVRGPKSLRNVSIQDNVGVQNADDLQTERTKKFSGVTVDPASVSSLSVRGNELYGYSGSGIEVNSDVSDLAVQHNAVTSPGLAGVRLVGASDGVVTGNLVTGTGTAGVRLKGCDRVAVAGNYVRRAGGVGVRVDGGDGRTGTEVAGNYVAGTGESGDGGTPGIVVRDAGVRVRDNAVRGAPGPAIAEAGDAAGNVYDGNWAAGEGPAWRIRSPSSRVRNHDPPVDVHRGASADGTTVTVDFDRPYERPPRLAFGRTGGGVRGRSFRTDGDGNVVGVTLEVASEGGTVDLFVGGT